MIDRLLGDFKADGFCKAEKILDEASVEQLRSDIAEFIKKEGPTLDGRDINYAPSGEVNSIHCLHRYVDRYFGVLQKREIFEMVSELLGDEAELRAMELFAKPAGSGLPSPVHQDNFYWCVVGASALTVWTALDVCDETNGGLYYYKGSNQLGILDHKDSFAPGSSQTIADTALVESMGKDRVIVSLNPGDALIHHSLTLHGSDANKGSRSRRGVTMQFKGKSAQYDQKLKAHYEARLMEQVAARAKNNAGL